MKGWIAAGAAVGAGALALRKGLHTVPEPFAPFRGDVPELEHAPLPAGLPEPVARYFEVVCGQQIPLLSGAVFGGRMTMRIKGPALPGRWRFGHVVGTGYRHHMELSVFGRRIVTAQEWYLDGHARLDLPTGVVEGEPTVDRAANLSMWGSTCGFLRHCWAGCGNRSTRSVPDSSCRRNRDRIPWSPGSTRSPACLTGSRRCGGATRAIRSRSAGSRACMLGLASRGSGCRPFRRCSGATRRNRGCG